MMCSYWLLVSLVLMFGVAVQGQSITSNELCYNDSWTYFGNPHGCFKRFSISKTWTEARDYCLAIQIGSSYGVKTRLAKIDDRPTNTFVRGLCAEPYKLCWIGIHDINGQGKFRWVGYPNQIPKFNATTWDYPERRYVTISKEGWRVQESDWKRHFVCHHAAKTISDVTCVYQLVPKELTVTCTSQNNPIKANCQWTHKYQGYQNFQTWQSVVGTSSNETQIENTGNSFVTTTCWISLTQVQSRPITVKMKMYPDTDGGTDVSTNQLALSEGQITIDIVPPDRPVFKLQNRTLQTLSPIHFSKNDRIYLTCEVPSGNPSVQSVTLSCQFPFHNSDVDNKNTVTGIAYVMDETASRDMNGKTCTCIGNHLTGRKESLPLTFNVTYPAEVTNFTVNGRASLLVVDLDVRLTFSCLVDGNPLPSVYIRKLGTSYVDTSDWLSQDSGMIEQQVIEARCDHNGRYRCYAYNVENHREDWQDLDLRVRCAPNYCNETSRDLKMAVKPGEFQIVNLCVVAYPMPYFTLWKHSEDAGWQTAEDLAGHVTHVTNYGSQQDVTIGFPVLEPSHLGQYALEYSGNTAPSRLYFNLTALLTPCKGEENAAHEIKLGRSVSITLCVSAFPLPSSLVLHRGNESNRNSTTDFVIGMLKDGDTLTGVEVTLHDLKATDLGHYLLFDREVPSSYLNFSLVEAQSGASSGNAAAIAGAVVAVVFVIVIVVIVVICVLRRRRKGENPKEIANKDGAKKSREKYGSGDYAKVDISQRRKGPKDNEGKGQSSEDVVQIYDNEGFLVQHRTSKDYDDETYSNMPAQNNTSEDNNVPESKTEKGEGDLVYIELALNVTANNKAKPKTKSEPQGKPEEGGEDGGKERGDATEYAEINASATIRMRREKEEEENDKSKGRGVGEEHSVYANVPAGDNGS